MDFGQALHALNNGQRVCRQGWNGKGMWLFHIKDWLYAEEKLADIRPKLPFIAMKTADDCVVPWLASQTDALAKDWHVVE